MVSRIAIPLACAAALSAMTLARGEAPNAGLTSSAAVQAASTAVSSCEKMGFHVTATVVDAAGIVLATVRGDGAAPHTVSTSARKAYTAASSHMSTSQLVKIVTANADAAGMRDIEGFLLLTGGVPIKAGNDVLGGIGVSGSPGPESDEKCATAGLASLGVMPHK
ncbi:MAG TPA: heme-binding protein [Steroidobacteraceae bacterium]|nr:heme-binding protein [Steroidobacteraceae bacterium]